MISLVMLAIMAGCAVGLYLKGTLAQGIIMIFNALVAGLVAFSFFEMAARYLVGFSPGIAPWAPMACFLLLVLVVFALLMAIEMQITKGKVDMGLLPERIGRPIAGVVLGYVATGYLLVAAAMAPLPSEYPYPRFDTRSPNPASPKKPMLSPDGFVSGLFATISDGSFSAIRTPQSFALLHAGYVDQLHLNRISGTNVPLMTETPAIDAPRKAGVWNAPQGLRDANGRPPSVPTGTSLMLVRVDFKKGALKDSSKFTLAQIRLICGAGDKGEPLGGKGQAVYPLGYIGPGGHLETKSLGEIITIEGNQAQGDAITMDLAFAVPTNLTPVLLEFKRNNVVQLSKPASAEDAPQPVPFSAPARERGSQVGAGAEPNAQQPTAPSSRPGKGKGGKKKKAAGGAIEEN